MTRTNGDGSSGRSIHIRLRYRRSLGVITFPVSRLGRKEIGDRRGIDAWNLSPRKRRDGNAVVTFIPFGPRASVENPGCGIIQCRSEIIVAEVLPENFNILVRGVCHGVSKKALRKFEGFFRSSKAENALCNSQKFLGVDHRSLPCEAKT